MSPTADMALEFNLLARDNASRAFRQVGDEAERTGKRASSGLRSLGTAASAAGALLAGAGLAQGFKALYEAADESRKITARTENVISQMGNAAGVSADQVGELAGAIAAKTGVDDEAIQSGQNLLLTFGNIKDAAGEGNDVFSQTSQLMVDMSAAMGTDASSSAIQLGKALNDPIKGITALSKAGVSFTEQQKEQIRTLVESGDILGAQKIILGELEKQFGGAAEAMATPLDKLRVTSGNLVEELGGYLLPVVDDVATSLNEGLLPSASDLGPKLADAAREVAKLVPQLLDMAETGLDLATATLPLLTGGMGLLLNIADKLGPALPGVVTGLAAMKIAGGVGAGVETLAVSMGRADGKMAGFGRGLGTASIALPVIGAGISVLTNELNHDETALASNTATMSGWITSLNKGGAAAAQTRQDMEQARVVFKQMGIDLTQTKEWEQAFDAASEGSRRYWESLNPVEQATQKVTEWTNNLSYALETNGANSEEARSAQERLAYWTDLQTSRQSTLAGAVASATGTTDTYTTGLQNTADAAKEVQDQTNLLKSALDALTGTNVSVDEATSAYYAALDQAKTSLGDLSGEVVANNGLLNLQSERGREVADRLTGLAGNSNGYLAALKAQGASQADVAALDGQLRDSFFQTARQMTGNDNVARALTDRYYGLPDERNTTVGVNDQATGPLGVIQTMLAGIKDKTVRLTVEQRITGGATANSLGLNSIPPRAAGGPVWSNQTFLVGERGPELVQFGSSGFVTPADKTAAVLGASAGASGQSMQVTLQLDRGAVTDLLDGRVVNVLETVIDRGAYNG